MSNEAEKASKEASREAENILDEAKATANKVGDIISKEAEELEDRAKEAGKRYVASL